MGEAVRYDGGDCSHHLSERCKILLQQWQNKGLLLSLCPEVSGGLPVPRPAAEIVGEQVLTQSGMDVSHVFHLGAAKALALCQQYDI
ncbi:MAG: DUF523 domain-containing protein, partial [Ghiorsea sp.]|nr:DUF523 domain-containing protein [Ghiorsea sp.]